MSNEPGYWFESKGKRIYWKKYRRQTITTIITIKSDDAASLLFYYKFECPFDIVRLSFNVLCKNMIFNNYIRLIRCDIITYETIMLDIVFNIGCC